jgi:hypothetical protein
MIQVSVGIEVYGFSPIFPVTTSCKVCYAPTNNRLAIIQNEEGCDETQAKQLMDEEI